MAKTACREVELEVKTSQSVIDKISDGSHCASLGQKAVTKAKKEWEKRKVTLIKAKAHVKVAFNAKVNVGSYQFSSLKEGHCGQVFGSASYIAASKKYHASVKIVSIVTGRVIESKKGYYNAVASAKRQVHKCYCDLQHLRNETWKVQSNPKIRHKQDVAHAKCKMMSCVLNGTPVTSKACKSHLTKLHTKTLIRPAETERNCGPSPSMKKAQQLKVKEKSDKKAERDRKVAAKERSQKAFKEKNAKGRERATKRERADKAREHRSKEQKAKEASAKKKERHDKTAKRERAAKAEKRKSVERQIKERHTKQNAWHLAMIINGGSKVMDYNSGHWTSSRIGNLGQGNSKTKWFNVPARSIRLDMHVGRNKRSVSTRHNLNQSLRQIFGRGFTRTGIPAHSWRNLGGNNKFGFQNHCNYQGFNNNALWDNWKTDCRFCSIMNQERDCRTPDSAIGIGFKSASITAGGVCGCCNNGGHCRNQAARAYVYVKQT